MPAPAIAAIAARLAANPQLMALATEALAGIVGGGAGGGLLKSLTAAAGPATSAAGSAGGQAAAAAATTAAGAKTASASPQIINIVQNTLMGAGMSGAAAGSGGSSGSGGSGGGATPAGSGLQPPGSVPPVIIQPPGGSGQQPGGFDLSSIVKTIVTSGAVGLAIGQAYRITTEPIRATFAQGGGFLFGSQGQGGFARLGEAQANATGRGNEIRGLAKAVTGDMRMPGVREFIDPVSFVRWVAEIRANIIELPQRLKEFGNSLAESQRHLKDYNGQISVAFSRLDIDRFRRNVQLGAMTAGSTERLTRAQSKLEEAKLPLEAITANITNELTAALENAVAEGINRTLNPVIDAARKWLGMPDATELGSSPLVDLSKLIASGKFSRPLRTIGLAAGDPRLGSSDDDMPGKYDATKKGKRTTRVW